MPRLITISDSNAYISTSDAAVSEIASREHCNSVVAWASYFVADEMIARSVDPDPKEAGKGRRALGRLSSHATMYDGSVQRINWLTDPRQQLSELLFGVARKPEQRKADIYGTVVFSIARATSPSDWPQWVVEAAQAIRTEVDQYETAFVGHMWEIVKTVAPQAESWSNLGLDPAKSKALATEVASPEGNRLCAEMFAGMIAAYSGLGATESQIQAGRDTLISGFPLAMRVFNLQLIKVLLDGVDMTQKDQKNTIWDMHFALSVPASARIANTPVWLITSDSLIVQAAKGAGLGHLVCPLAEYQKLIHDPAAWRERIDAFEGHPPTE